jgi:hypothetical protein
MAKAAAEVVEDKDYTTYKDKPATDLQERFGEWIVDKLDLTFGSKKEQAAFLEGVRLATALRMEFQASPENQAVLNARRASAGDRELETARAQRPTKKAAAAAPTQPPAERRPAKKATARKATKAAAPVEAAEETVSEPQPSRPPAKRRPAQRRPAQTSSAVPEDEAPF